jgi:hypothetical protein
MTQQMVSRERSVNGVPTSLADLGYTDVGCDDAWQAQHSGPGGIGFHNEAGDPIIDTTKFPNGAWCKEGDFILVRTYSGTRFKIFGKEFRLINDDQVDAVVQDPRGLTRA